MKKIILTALSSGLLLASSAAFASNHADHDSCDSDYKKSPSFNYVTLGYSDSGASNRVEAFNFELSAKVAGNFHSRMTYSDFYQGSEVGIDVLYAHRESDSTTLYAGLGVRSVNIDGLQGDAGMKYFVGLKRTIGSRWEAGLETVLQDNLGESYLSFGGELKYNFRKNWTANVGYSLAEKTELDRWSVGVSYHF